MGKNKLRKFSEMETLQCVHQYPFGTLKREGGCPLKGHWRGDVFPDDSPITLELGCGKGEYTVGLARRYADRNFIGIDIKGARIWSGATTVEREGLKNAAFLRTSIELIEHFFTPGEVDEIWITFPDPQMKKASKRLTGTRFLELYRKVFGEKGGIIHLKTDSPFLYTYTRELVRLNNLPLLAATDDLYANEDCDEELRKIRTHYEQQWLDRGLTIKYLCFRLTPDTPLAEPEIDIPLDTYRSYSRGYIQNPQLLQ